MVSAWASFFSWWYGAGWREQVSGVVAALGNTVDAFSLTTLPVTLFSPFRQISTGRANGPIGVLMRSFIDKLVSRLIGALIRTVVIGVGLLGLVAVMGLGVIRVMVWPLMPLLPLYCVALAVIGVGA